MWSPGSRDGRSGVDAPSAAALDVAPGGRTDASPAAQRLAKTPGKAPRSRSILLSRRIFALIRQLSFTQIKAFVIRRRPAGSGDSATPTQGDKLHNVAKVDHFNATQCLLFLTPVSTTVPNRSRRFMGSGTWPRLRHFDDGPGNSHAGKRGPEPCAFRPIGWLCRRTLHGIHRVVNRMQGPTCPLDRLRCHRPLHGATWVHSATDTTRNKQP